MGNTSVYKAECDNKSLKLTWRKTVLEYPIQDLAKITVYRYSMPGMYKFEPMEDITIFIYYDSVTFTIKRNSRNGNKKEIYNNLCREIEKICNESNIQFERKKNLN